MVAFDEGPLVLALALLVDATFGEPPNRLHPVVWMGSAVRALERLAPSGAVPELLWGAAMALVVPGASAALAALVVRVAEPSTWLGMALAVLLLKPTFALRALGRAAMRVHDDLARGDLEAARSGLRSLCSRDPSRLDATQVAQGATESVAENASDSFVAPLFYFALAGLPGAVLYRAVNTMDAMIGYHGRYEHLGKAAARLDDLLNLIPARLTTGLLLVAGALRGNDARRGWRVLRRDGARTESPNAGRPMAAMAGLLGVELAKPGAYRLGDAVRPVNAATIAEAWRTTRLTCGIAAGLALAGSAWGNA